MFRSDNKNWKKIHCAKLWPKVCSTLNDSIFRRQKQHFYLQKQHFDRIFKKFYRIFKKFYRIFKKFYRIFKQFYRIFKQFNRILRQLNRILRQFSPIFFRMILEGGALWNSLWHLASAARFFSSFKVRLSSKLAHRFGHFFTASKFWHFSALCSLISLE